MERTLHVDVKRPDPVMPIEIMIVDDDDDDGDDGDGDDDDDDDDDDVAVSNEKIEGGQVTKLEIKNAIKHI